VIFVLSFPLTASRDDEVIAVAEQVVNEVSDWVECCPTTTVRYGRIIEMQ